MADKEKWAGGRKLRKHTVIQVRRNEWTKVVMKRENQKEMRDTLREPNDLEKWLDEIQIQQAMVDWWSVKHSAVSCCITENSLYGSELPEKVPQRWWNGSWTFNDKKIGCDSRWEIMNGEHVVGTTETTMDPVGSLPSRLHRVSKICWTFNVLLCPALISSSKNKAHFSNGEANHCDSPILTTPLSRLPEWTNNATHVRTLLPWPQGFVQVRTISLKISN